MPRLLFEIGCEELPAAACMEAALQLPALSLEHLGVHFDVWKTESSVHDEGWVERGVARLRETGKLYESEGATWFRSTDYGDDKDRIVVRFAQSSHRRVQQGCDLRPDLRFAFVQQILHVRLLFAPGPADFAANEGHR